MYIPIDKALKMLYLYRITITKKQLNERATSPGEIMKIKEVEVKKNILDIIGENGCVVLSFNVIERKDDMLHPTEYKPYVVYKKTTGRTDMLLEEFIAMAKACVISRDRHNYFIEPIANRHCDNEIYPSK